MVWKAEVREAPPPEAMARLCDAIAPGSRPGPVRELHGGLDAGMHAFVLIEPGGARRRLVLRRFSPHRVGDEPEVCARTWQTLTALAAADAPTPRPVWHDPEGTFLDAPALVMTRLPGRGYIVPRDVAGWIEQFAAALAAVHRTPLDGRTRDLLVGPEAWLARALGRNRERKLAHPDGPALFAAIDRLRPRIAITPALTHNDYWAGNTVWLRGRLCGVVDWDDAVICDPGLDLGYARMDLSTLIGGDAPERFLRAYEAAGGHRVENLPFWDLVGAARALPDTSEEWLPGLHELGARHMTADLMRTRLRAFIGDALRRGQALASSSTL